MLINRQQRAYYSRFIDHIWWWCLCYVALLFSGYSIQVTHALSLVLWCRYTWQTTQGFLHRNICRLEQHVHWCEDCKGVAYYHCVNHIRLLDLWSLLNLYVLLYFPCLQFQAECKFLTLSLLAAVLI